MSPPAETAGSASKHSAEVQFSAECLRQSRPCHTSMTGQAPSLKMNSFIFFTLIESRIALKKQGRQRAAEDKGSSRGERQNFSVPNVLLACKAYTRRYCVRLSPYRFFPFGLEKRRCAALVLPLRAPDKLPKSLSARERFPF